MAGALLALPLAAFAAPVVYVNDDWAGLDNGDPVNVEAPLPVGTATFGTDAFASIIDAVDAVDADGIVWVAPGNYEEGAPIVIDKSLELRGANYGVSPNNPDGSPATRGDESIILAHEHSDAWAFSGALIDIFGSGNGKEVVIDGFLLEGFNPSIATGTEPIGLNGTDPVGSNAAVFSDASEVTFANNIVQNVSQFPYYGWAPTGGANYATWHHVHDNRILNNGVPNELGFGMGASLVNARTYGHLHDNYLQHNRGGFQVQSMTINVPGRDPIIEDNTILDVESIGIFLNLFNNTANDYVIRGNSIRGLGPDRGTGGVNLVTQRDGTGQRNHQLLDNEISDILSGYFFVANDTEKQRITGGTLENVSYGLAVTNRLGYRGFADYQSSGSEVDAATGRDGIGGWASFMSPAAVAAVPETGLTAEIALPDDLDDATGQTPFVESDFTGKVALLTAGGDASVAAQNALDAGAVAVIIAATDAAPPNRPTGTTNPEVDIPTTSIDQDDADVIRNDINVNGNTVTVTLYPWDFPTNSYGVNAPAVVSSQSGGELVNVKILGTTVAGFGLIDIPNELGPGNVPGPVVGSVLGGSTIQDSPYGALIVGQQATLNLESVKLEANEVGVRIVEGALNAKKVNVLDNTDVGIRVTGDTAAADILNSNFDGQDTNVELSDNPTAFVVAGSSFWDTTSTAIENLTPLLGDVMAQGNYWGDPSGPNDDAGVINGSGARISEGVDASDFIDSPALVPDSDFFTDTLGNGLFDWLEVLLGYDPTDPDDPNREAYTDGLDPEDWEDPDGDNLPNWVEDILGTDPNEADTDGDGIRDDYELFRGTEPNNINEFPPFGDANFDGNVNTNDALDIFRVFLGLQDFTTINPAESDMNLDGTIDNVDGVILINWLLDNVEVIPFGDEAP